MEQRYNELTHDLCVRAVLEAAEGIALELEERILELLDGDEEALDLEPVKISIRPDGMTGKLREIADLSPIHQLVGHLVKLGLDPLLDARLEYGQCASIPGRGQTGLKRRVERWLRRKSREKVGCASSGLIVSAAILAITSIRPPAGRGSG